MKKFLFACAIALLSFTATMATETNVVPEDDVGYVIPNVPTFEVMNLTIEAWQAPVVLNMESEQSAQVICAYSDLVQPTEVSQVLVQIKWPYSNSQINYTSYPRYINICAPPTNYTAYNSSFMVARTKLNC